MNDRLQEAAKQHHLEAVLALYEIEDELTALMEARDKRQRLADSIEQLYPSLFPPPVPDPAHSEWLREQPWYERWVRDREFE